MEFKRKNIRLSEVNYLGQRSYFVTTCCHKRRPLLSDARVAGWAIKTLDNFSRRCGFAIHAYCAMPNHLHFLAIGLGAESNLLEFVGLFKQHTGFHYERRRNLPLWQFKFYDHILRRNEAIDAVAGYIWMNPVRKGLCSDPFVYEFSGSFTLDWRKSAQIHNHWVPLWQQQLGKENAALKRGAT